MRRSDQGNNKESDNNKQKETMRMSIRRLFERVSLAGKRFPVYKRMNRYMHADLEWKGHYPIKKFVA